MGKRWLYLGKMVVFGQIGSIRANWFYLGFCIILIIDGLFWPEVANCSCSKEKTRELTLLDSGSRQTYRT